MTDRPVVLSLDISSSGVRARLHDRRFTTVAEASADLSTIADADGQSVHAFGDILDAAVNVIRSVAATSDVVIEAIAASGTASSFAWAHRDSSGAISEVSDVLLWSDARAGAVWAQLRDAVSDAYERTLCPPDASYWPAKLLWSHDHGAGPTDVYGGGKDFVVEWLTGEFVTDPMSAGSTGILGSQAALDWDAELIELVGISATQLPRLVAATTTAPLKEEVADLLGLPAGIPVAAGGMDGPLTQIGAAGFDRRVASCTIGTSIAFRANSVARAVDPERRVWCYPVDESHWVAGGAGNNGGNVLTWMRDRFGGGASVGEIAASAFTVEPGGELIFVPYLNGERAPLWRSELRAAFIGLGANDGLPELGRAAVDGIGAALIELAATVESLTGTQESVRLTGGFIQEQRWVQAMTDALGRRTSVSVPDSATATGVAMIAWAAAEGVPIDQVFVPSQGDSWQPDPDSHERYLSVAKRVSAARELLWPEGGETYGG
jgi:gluconokinase